MVHITTAADAHRRVGLPAPADHTLAPDAEAALRRDLARAGPADEGDVAVQVLARRGGPDAHLATLAEVGRFDLVVVGQRRNSLIEQLWVSSVARGVLRTAPVSVACVPPPLGAAAGPVQQPRVVVVGVDFTDAGDAALRLALGLVANGGTVHVVHVLPALATSDEDARAARERAWQALVRLPHLAPSAERAVTLERHVAQGGAAEQVLAVSQRVGAELIVLGARNRSTLSRALLGSVAMSVIEAARVPVVLVPLVPS